MSEKMMRFADRDVSSLSLFANRIVIRISVSLRRQKKWCDSQIEIYLVYLYLRIALWFTSVTRGFIVVFVLFQCKIYLETNSTNCKIPCDVSGCKYETRSYLNCPGTKSKVSKLIKKVAPKVVKAAKKNKIVKTAAKNVGKAALDAGLQAEANGD